MPFLKQQILRFREGLYFIVGAARFFFERSGEGYSTKIQSPFGDIVVLTPACPGKPGMPCLKQQILRFREGLYF